MTKKTGIIDFVVFNKEAGSYGPQSRVLSCMGLYEGGVQFAEQTKSQWIQTPPPRKRLSINFRGQVNKSGTAQRTVQTQFELIDPPSPNEPVRDSIHKRSRSVQTPAGYITRDFLKRGRSSSTGKTDLILYRRADQRSWKTAKRAKSLINSADWMERRSFSSWRQR